MLPSRPGLAVWALLCLTLGGGLHSCAFVKFERSPYAIRGLEVVYSAQEDLTFLVWRLRRGVDPSVVRFELFVEGEDASGQGGSYQPIDLTRTAFPADPFDCDKEYTCFQYQLPGRYELPRAVERPLRSIHEDEGIYAGSIPRTYEAAQTFGSSPVAIENNVAVDPRVYDWFQINRIPIKRRFEWQFTASSQPYGLGGADDCAAPVAGAWSVLSAPQPVAYAWVETPKCLAVRPRRRTADSPWVIGPLAPSAELYNETQNYLPPEERPPLIYGYLIDLLIRSETRCTRAQDLIVRTIDEAIGKRAPDAIRLGVFTPTDPETGRPLNGCGQAADQDYPVRQMAEAAKAAAARFDPKPVKIIWIYMNNVELPPSERVVTQLIDLGEQSQTPNGDLTSWGIGSNTILGLFPWTWSLGWSSVDDEVFTDSLKNWAEVNTPFRTMLHDLDTQVLITRPVPAPSARRFKLCDVTPDALTGVGSTDQPVDDPPGLPFYTWPPSGSPHYTIGLEPQILVPFESYVRETVSVVVEVCARFCEYPFRRASGVDLPSWEGTEVCQWSP